MTIRFGPPRSSGTCPFQNYSMARVEHRHGPRADLLERSQPRVLAWQVMISIKRQCLPRHCKHLADEKKLESLANAHAHALSSPFTTAVVAAHSFFDHSLLHAPPDALAATTAP